MKKTIENLNIDRKPKVKIITFGCQMNEHDSEIILGLLMEKGYQETQDKEEADVAIINTCSIRENADKRFFGTLGQYKKNKEKNKDFIVCVCGCMMQQQHIIDSLKEKYPWVDVIVGTHNIHHLPMLIENLTLEKKKQMEIFENHLDIVEDLPSKRLYKEKALVNIMFGCNNFCTYCIVPFTRGRERSRNPESIVREVENLVADGVIEVMLLGQNVNSYKGIFQENHEEFNFKKDKECDFPDLLYLLNQIEGLERIRFMTSHPKDVSPKLIEAFKSCEKLCKYIHLPIQSGSNKILRAMNRRYTREAYIDLVKRVREAVPDITLSTDIIVGFPGETREDFNETLDMVKTVGYDSAFTFLYSIRKGTPAEKFEDQVEEKEKHIRFNELVNSINEISLKKNLAYIGRIEKVSVEGESKNKKEVLTGRTDGYKLVNFIGDKSLIGKIVEVEIINGNTFSLEGRLING